MVAEWEPLYRAVQAEGDPRTLTSKITAAEAAIFLRLLAAHYERWHREEAVAIYNALRLLRRLRSRSLSRTQPDALRKTS